MQAVVAALTAVTALAGCSALSIHQSPTQTDAASGLTPSEVGSPSPAPNGSLSADDASCSPTYPDGLEALVAQTLVVMQPYGGPMASAWTGDLGGIFLGRPEDLPQVQAFMAQPGLRPFFAVDEEGGRVSWLLDAPDGGLSAQELARYEVEEVYSVSYARGIQLRERGIDVNFAPVVDLYPGQDDGVIGDRAFADDPGQVTALASAFASGMVDAGIVPTLKHFPGHGLAKGDSHSEAVQTDAIEVLEAQDILPYRDLIDGATPDFMVMVGHLDVPGLTQPGRPATLDPAAYSYLRENLGFTGLIITDELSGMAAVADQYARTDAIIGALRAGADLVLIADSSDLDTLIRDVAAAVRAGELSRKSIKDAAKRVVDAKMCQWPTRQSAN